MTDKLQIGLVLPDVLGTYGDVGNAVVLRERAISRGIEAEIVECVLDEPLPTTLDMYVLGGGEDTAQSVAVEYLKSNSAFQKVCDRDVPVLAVSASMQILGNSYVDSYNRKLEGLGILDIDTLSKGERIIGETVSVPILPGMFDLLSGFENHAGITNVGKDALPLGRLLVGVGNAGECYHVDALDEHDSTREWDKYAEEMEISVFNRYDGAFNGNIIGTYMHGPCLARNPELADWLLAKAVGHPLEEFSVELIDEFRKFRFENTMI